jgi:tetratricopeptide (TPR) repeat protein
MNEMIAYSNRLTRILYTAAAFSLILTFFAGYLYQKAAPQNLFKDHFQVYQLHIMRGAGAYSDLKEAYSNGNMDAVIRDFNGSASTIPEDYLLTAVAFLEKNKPQKAIETITLLHQKNASAKSDFFEKEADYYLGMSYLANGQQEKALPIFTKIQADTENPYNSSVNGRFIWMLKLSIARK